MSIPTAEQFRAMPGHGVQAVVGGRQFQLGGPALLRTARCRAPDAALAAAIDRAASRGQAAITMLEQDTAARGVRRRGRRAGGVARGRASASTRRASK